MRALLFFLITMCASAEAQETIDYRGRRFIGFEQFGNFKPEIRNGMTNLVSPAVDPGFKFDQLLVSWNLRGAPTNRIVIEARAIYLDRVTEWYTLAKWSLAPEKEGDRSSIKDQKDDNGRVDTDVLKLKERATAAQIRIRLENGTRAAGMRFLGLSFCDSTVDAAPLPANKAAWGKTLVVKERSQANYPEGVTSWCSPTAMSMLMSFWATNVNRPKLDYDVPDVARGVNDPGWGGTGNWPFNTAFAGSHTGVRAYVARFSDVSELEDWITAGMPVAISVSYGYLKGQPEPANGHLVVCIGFDESGNIIVNDPGRSAVQQTYSRENLIRAWAESENTVYIVYPENRPLPKDRFDHWFN